MLRAATSVLRSPASVNVLKCAGTRGMALEGVQGFSDKESAVENLYFTKEDQRLLGKLLSKVKAQSDVSDEHAAQGVIAAERSALNSIIGKYKVSNDDVEKLMKWKHTHY